MFLVIINRQNDFIQINLVCGGGGEGVFSFSLGSETAYLNRTKKLLREYCEINKLVYEEMVKDYKTQLSKYS
jgi:hypothetical protein